MPPKHVTFFIADRTPNTHGPGLVNLRCIKECKMERAFTDVTRFFLT